MLTVRALDRIDPLKAEGNPRTPTEINPEVEAVVSQNLIEGDDHRVCRNAGGD